MSPEQVLMLTMVDVGMKIYPGTLDSLREAIEENNIYFFDKDGEPSGFVTWYFEEPNILVINNLCIYSTAHHKLYALRNFFHKRYPNLLKVKWHDDNRGKDTEYVFSKNEHHQRSVSSTKNTSC